MLTLTAVHIEMWQGLGLEERENIKRLLYPVKVEEEEQMDKNDDSNSLPSLPHKLVSFDSNANA